MAGSAPAGSYSGVKNTSWPRTDAQDPDHCLAEVQTLLITDWLTQTILIIDWLIHNNTDLWLFTGFYSFVEDWERGAGAAGHEMCRRAEFSGQRLVCQVRAEII